MIKTLGKIFSLPRFIAKKWLMSTNMTRLQNIASEAGEAIKLRPSKIKILLAPSFAIYHTLKIHDVLLPAILSAKGAEIYYLSNAYGLPTCHVCGGIRQMTNEEQDLCANCQRFYRNDDSLVFYLKKFAKILHVEEFIKPAQLKYLQEYSQRIPEEDLATLQFEGIAIGKYATDIVKNLGYVGNPKLIPNYQKLLRETILSTLIYYHYFHGAITKSVKPDIILSHDAFYAPWALLHDLAKKFDITFYNYYSGLRHNTFHYAKGQIAMHLNIDPLFEKWKHREIHEKELKRLDTIFSRRRRGKIYNEKTEWIGTPEEQNRYQAMLRSPKPLAVLYGNVLWDLTALGREIVFPTVQKSFLATIEFFINHPEYNLIIKPHPGELGGIHESKEKLSDLIKESFADLPKNVLVLNPKSTITSYDLIAKSKISVVYTTTVGMESVILGTPTITLGKSQYRNKGFTHDPATPHEFFQILEKLLTAPPPDIAAQQELAKKYYYLYFFVYFHDFKIVEFDLVYKTKVVPKSLDDLLGNRDFNTLADAIMRKDKIPYFDYKLEK